MDSDDQSEAVINILTGTEAGVGRRVYALVLAFAIAPVGSALGPGTLEVGFGRAGVKRDKVQDHTREAASERRALAMVE